MTEASFTGNPTGFAPVLGSVTCPHQDGDYVATVYDMRLMSTGYCMVRQVGQGQVWDQSYSRAEARELAAILLRFASS